MAGPKTIVFDGVTLHTPSTWDADVRGNVAYVGLLAGGPADVNLRIVRDFTASTDSLKPTTCNDAPGEHPTSVETVESGFRPVGQRTAEFRLWRAVCAKGPEEHRAWVLPVSRLAFYEQVHEGHPENVYVVTTAELQ
jgi:hypothetical protein